jgi:hypothetical protein
MGLYWLGLYYCSPNWFWLWPCLLWILTSFTLQINPSYLLIFFCIRLWKPCLLTLPRPFLSLEIISLLITDYALLLGTFYRVLLSWHSIQDTDALSILPLLSTWLNSFVVWSCLKDSQNDELLMSLSLFYRPMWCSRYLLHLPDNVLRFQN